MIFASHQCVVATTCTIKNSLFLSLSLSVARCVVLLFSLSLIFVCTSLSCACFCSILFSVFFSVAVWMRLLNYVDV